VSGGCGHYVVAKISNAKKNILEKRRAKILLARKNFVKKAMVLTSDITQALHWDRGRPVPTAHGRSEASQVKVK